MVIGDMVIDKSFRYNRPTRAWQTNWQTDGRTEFLY